MNIPSTQQRISLTALFSKWRYSMPTHHTLLACVALCLLVFSPLSVSMAQQELEQRGITRITKAPTEIYKELYAKRYAVVVGINKYPKATGKFQTLKAAVNDARHIAEKLQALHYEVLTLLDEQATKTAILSTLGDQVGQKAKENDLVMFFFAGHGDSDGEGLEQMGFILPFDYDSANPYSSSIAMTDLQNIAKRIKAKHMMFAMDSCFSGGIFDQRAGVATPTPGQAAVEHLRNLTQKRARLVLTAGAKDELANESGGTGLFTQALLEGLAGQADMDHSGYITAVELGLYIQKRVPQYGVGLKQSPQLGTLPGSQGDVVLAMLSPLEDIQQGIASPLGREQADTLKKEMEQKQREFEEKQARIMEELQEKVLREQEKMQQERVERERQARLDQERLEQERERTRQERSAAETDRRRAEEEREAAERARSQAPVRRPPSTFGGGF